MNFVMSKLQCKVLCVFRLLTNFISFAIHVHTNIAYSHLIPLVKKCNKWTPKLPGRNGLFWLPFQLCWGAISPTHWQLQLQLKPIMQPIIITQHKTEVQEKRFCIGFQVIVDHS